MGHSPPSLITLAPGAFDRLFAPTLGHLSFCPVIGWGGGGVGVGTAGIDKPRGGAFPFFLGHIPGHLTDFFAPTPGTFAFFFS